MGHAWDKMPGMIDWLKDKMRSFDADIRVSVASAMSDEQIQKRLITAAQNSTQVSYSAQRALPQNEVKPNPPVTGMLEEPSVPGVTGGATPEELDDLFAPAKA